MYSKGYLQSYHTHIPVSFFGTKMQMVLTVCTAAGGIKGLMYMGRAPASRYLVAFISFSTSRGAATIRERRLIESGV